MFINVWIRVLSYTRIRICFSILIIITIILICIHLDQNECPMNALNNSYNVEMIVKKFTANASKLTAEPNWSEFIDNKVSIYSAFLTEESIVRITSIIDQQFRPQIECHFMRFKDSLVVFSINATIRVLVGNYLGTKRLAASEIRCILPLKYHSKINFVKIRLPLKPSYEPMVKVMRSDSYSQDFNDLRTVVCIRPVYQSRHLMSSLIEFLAYYVVNGINRFVFYDYDIDHYLKQFISSLNFTQIIPFRLTFDPQLIHAFGQMAAINDCLLRHSNSPVILVDLDEFIVVQNPHNSSVQSMIEREIRNKSVSSLVINNRFFCNEFQSQHHFPRIFSHNKIQDYFWRSGDRSKIIILRPNTVIDVWIHSVYKSKTGFLSKELSDSEVLLYHYRSCCGINQEFVHLEHLNLYFKTIRDDYSEDNSMKLFETQINHFIALYIQL